MIIYSFIFVSLIIAVLYISVIVLKIQISKMLNSSAWYFLAVAMALSGFRQVWGIWVFIYNGIIWSELHGMPPEVTLNQWFITMLTLVAAILFFIGLRKLKEDLKHAWSKIQ